MAAKNKGKPAKHTKKIEKTEKLNDYYYCFGSTDDNYDRIKVVRYVMCR